TRQEEEAKRISGSEAADIIGRRFHGDQWDYADLAALDSAEAEAPDIEAWRRAAGVQERLRAYIAEGQVTAYATTDDGVGLTELPTHWVTPASFRVGANTGRFLVWTDQWEPLWVDRLELERALPSIARPRQKHTFEWKPIVQ